MNAIKLFLGTVLLALAATVPAKNKAQESFDVKTQMRLALSQASVSIDPLKIDSVDGKRVHELIYQRLLSYDTDRSSVRLQIQLAAAMPKAIDAGLAFDVEIAQAKFMPAKGSVLAARAVRALDVKYSFDCVLRECDEKLPECSLLRGTIKSVQLRGERKLRFHLNAANYDFPYMLAMPIAAIVAPEGIARAEFYGSHRFHVAAQIAEKSLTLQRSAVEQVEPEDALGAPIRVMHFQVLADKTAQFQSFLRGELDFIDQLGALERGYLPSGMLGIELSQVGARLSLTPEPEIIYYYLSPSAQGFGGNSPAQIALRRAILQSYSVANEITQIRAGMGEVNTRIVPIEFPEQQEPATAAFAFDPQSANTNLDQHGFMRGADGWRRWPNGKALLLNYTSEPLAVVEPYREARRAQLAALGIRMNSVLDSYANNIQHAKDCQAPFWGAAWQATIPTPGYILGVLRSERIGADNLTCYLNPEFDRLHDQAQRSASGPKRALLYRQLTDIIQQDAIWQMGVRRQRASLFGPRLATLNNHPILYAPWESSRLVETHAQRSEELTYLKAELGQQKALAEFIRRNWFAMDAIAKQRGLIADFELLARSPSDTKADWDFMVRVRYPHPGGYAAIAGEFEAIRGKHQSVLIEGKGMRELGRVVRSEALTIDRENIK